MANETFRLSLEAFQDLTDIYEYFAQDNLDAAERVAQELLQAMLEIARMPGKGHRRDDLTKLPVRFWTVRSYQIIYKPEGSPLQIVAVLHGKRNIRRLLRER
ncbi:MAG TPA: type II toxin-antitoxin system RelE/ParE family toxin [Candidatus Acidoferrum sp.]|nr:type II toxin-antitoxin system RelE/ParE family toxin [Candidatus Acidoferrum sp.]